MHLSHFPLIFFLKKLFVLVCDGFPYHKLCVFAHRYLLPSPSWWTALATIHLETWQRLSTRHQPGTLHQLSSTNPPPCTLLYPVIWVVSSSEKSKYQYRYQLYLVYLVQVQWKSKLDRILHHLSPISPNLNLSPFNSLFFAIHSWCHFHSWCLPFLLPPRAPQTTSSTTPSACSLPPCLSLFHLFKVP